MRNAIYAISFALLFSVFGIFMRSGTTQVDSVANQEAAKPTMVRSAQQETAESSNQTPPQSMARIYETHEKVINYTVATPVYETRTREVKYTVMRPVTEKRVKDVNYTVMTTVTEEHAVSDIDNSKDRMVRTVKSVPETRVKAVSYTFTKMVAEEHIKKVAYKTCRIVHEKRQKTVQYTTCRLVPTTTLQNELEQLKDDTVDPMGSNRCLK